MLEIAGYQPQVEDEYDISSNGSNGASHKSESDPETKKQTRDSEINAELLKKAFHVLNHGDEIQTSALIDQIESSYHCEEEGEVLEVVEDEAIQKEISWRAIIPELAEEFVRIAGLNPEKTSRETYETLKFIEYQAGLNRDFLLSGIEGVGNWISKISRNKDLKKLNSLQGVEESLGEWLNEAGGIIYEINDLMEVLPRVVLEVGKYHEQ